MIRENRVTKARALESTPQELTLSDRDDIRSIIEGTLDSIHPESPDDRQNFIDWCDVLKRLGYADTAAKWMEEL